MPHSVPSRPFEKIGADIFTLMKRDYLLVVDYFSKFLFVFELHDKTTSSVITSLKSLYSIHGVPVTLFADNMPFASQQVQNFAVMWGFEIVTSSPDFLRYALELVTAFQRVEPVARLDVEWTQLQS